LVVGKDARKLKMKLHGEELRRKLEAQAIINHNMMIWRKQEEDLKASLAYMRERNIKRMRRDG